jgi:hypothetical protein
MQFEPSRDRLFRRGSSTMPLSGMPTTVPSRAARL